MLKTQLFILLVVYFICETALLILNHHNIRKNSNHNPFKDFLDEEAFRKSIHYSLSCNSFSILKTFYRSSWLGLIFGLELMSFFLNCFPSVNSLWGQSTVLFLWMFLLNLPTLPLDYLHTFQIESRFGFNRSSRKLWFMDQLKGIFVSACLQIPLITALLWLIQACPNTWWLWGTIGYTGLQVVLIWVYPKLILPLFNKLTSLEDGTLKQRLTQLGECAGFKATKIQVLDSSKRSTHSNAYYSGIGGIQHIVLYDTLLKQATEDEIVAVVAHEMGHDKCHHLPKQLLILGLGTGILLKLCDCLLHSDWIAAQLYVQSTTPLVVLVLLATAGSLFTYWLSPLFNCFSRHFEYQADAFAAKQYESCAANLIHALKKLYRENASNPFPHPWFSTFHYTHPTLIEREKALQKYIN